MFLVATETHVVPVFEPLVELVDFCVVTDQIVDCAGTVPICPHLMLARLRCRQRLLSDSVIHKSSFAHGQREFLIAG